MGVWLMVPGVSIIMPEERSWGCPVLALFVEEGEGGRDSTLVIL